MLLFAGCASPKPGGWGKYNGSIKTEWLPNSSAMRILEPVEYIGPDGKKWPAPAGAVVNGASIPRPMWSVVGSPFTGRYRDASVFHDFACSERTEQWQDVHTMFYTAMRCSGVKVIQAKIMFAAVWYYGPRWSKPTIFGTSKTVAVSVVDKREMSDIKDWIEWKNPSLDAIQNRIP